MAELRFSLLGPPSVELDGRSFAPARKKTAALLYWLAATGRALPRSSAAGLLWPEFAPERAKANLRFSLFDACEASGFPLFAPGRGALRFSAEVGVSTDCARFAALLSAEEGAESPRALLAAGEGDNGHAPRLDRRGSLEAALALYRGDFLAGFSLKDALEFEDWQLLEEGRWRTLALDALGRLVALDRAEGRDREAETHARRMIDIAPLIESGHRLVMEILAERGEVEEARAHYEAFARVLDRERGGKPGAATSRLYRELAERRSEALPSAPRAMDALPCWISDFVGRETELGVLLDLLGERRLVTLTGPGGVGKTRLAAEAARRLELAGREVHFVDLAPVLPGAALSRVAAALGGPLHPGEGERDFAGRLRDRSFLLLLDNCERLVDECSGLAEALLGEAPGCGILATSLEALRAEGETTLAIPPLALVPARAPAAEDSSLSDGASGDAVLECEAARLFVSRARQADPRFDADAQGGEILALCRCLDGLPLALELAAARLRSSALSCLLRELAEVPERLGEGPRSAAPHHRSLGALLDWSWSLLEPEEADSLEALAVFSGGFDAAAAEAVLGASAAAHLARLLDKSLVLPESHDRGLARWRLLDVVRLHAAARLKASGRSEGVFDAHLAHFSARAERLERALERIRGPEALDEAEREWANFQAAIDHARSRSRAGAALEIVFRLRRFLEVRGLRADLSRIIASFDAAAFSAAIDRGRYEELSILSVGCDIAFARTLGHLRAAEEAWEASGEGHRAMACRSRRLSLRNPPEAELVRAEAELEAMVGELEAGGRLSLALDACLDAVQLSFSATAGRWDRAEELLRRAERLSLRDGDADRRCRCLYWRAKLAKTVGRPAERERAIGEARAIARSVRSAAAIGELLGLEAECAMEDGDWGTAVARSRAAARFWGGSGDPGVVFYLRLIGAEALYMSGRIEEALVETRSLAVDHDGNPVARAPALAQLVWILVDSGRPAEARALLGDLLAAAEPGSAAEARRTFFLAKLLLAEGEEAEAERVFLACREMLPAVGDEAFENGTGRSLAWLRASCDPLFARRWLEEELERCLRTAPPFRALWAASVAARLLAAEGRLCAARKAAWLVLENLERQDSLFKRVSLDRPVRPFLTTICGELDPSLRADSAVAENPSLAEVSPTRFVLLVIDLLRELIRVEG